MPEIETERLILREWRESDLDPYARMCSDPEVMRYLPGVLDREGSEEQIAGFVRHWEERGFGLWAVEHRATGTFIGFAGLLRQENWPEGEHKTEVGWRLDCSFWGWGLATEAAREPALRVRGPGAGRHHQHNAAGKRRLPPCHGEGGPDLSGRDPLEGLRGGLVRHRS